MKDVANVKAATLLAHGNNDFNVMTKHAAQLYEALKAQGVPHQFFFHQGGHGGSPPDVLLNYWFTRYLWGQQNGVENLPKSWVVARDRACPPRESAVAGEHVNTATLTVADASPFRIGFTLTVPQTNANGTITNTTRLINNIAGNTLTLASRGRHGGRPAGGRRGDGQPRVRQPEPDAVPGVARSRLRRRRAPPGGGRARPRRADAGRRQRRPGDADRRRGRHRGDADERRRRGQPPALRDQRAQGAGPHQRHAARVPERVVQRGEGEPDGDPGQPVGERQRTILTRGWIDPENRNSTGRPSR